MEVRIIMGQWEALQYLQNQRKKSEHWFDMKEIREGLEKEGMSNEVLTRSLQNDLYKLTVFGFIEAKGIGLWDHKKVFRACK